MFSSLPGGIRHPNTDRLSGEKSSHKASLGFKAGLLGEVGEDCEGVFSIFR